MAIQLFGSDKCFETKKAERYFKERQIKYQYVDILKYGLSKGELQSVVEAVGLQNLINQGVREYEKLNLHIIRPTAMRMEILMNNPRLYRTPVVRSGRQATVGYKPEIWEQWLDR
jgi:arsenate reductase